MCLVLRGPRASQPRDHLAQERTTSGANRAPSEMCAHPLRASLSPADGNPWLVACGCKSRSERAILSGLATRVRLKAAHASGVTTWDTSTSGPEDPKRASLYSPPRVVPLFAVHDSLPPFFPLIAFLCHPSLWRLLVLEGSVHPAQDARVPEVHKPCFKIRSPSREGHPAPWVPAPFCQEGLPGPSLAETGRDQLMKSDWIPRSDHMQGVLKGTQDIICLRF